MLILWVSQIDVFVLQKGLFAISNVENRFFYDLFLPSMTWEYRGLQGVTGGYKALQGVTRGYRRLQGVKRGYRGLQEVTRGDRG